MKRLSRNINILFLFLCVVVFLIPLSAKDFNIGGKGKTRLEILENNYTTFKFINVVSHIELNEIETKNGNFVSLRIADYGRSNIVGEPEIPILKKLIEIPFEAELDIKITSLSYQEFSLAEYGFYNNIYPVQPPVSKNSYIPLNSDIVINEQSLLKDQYPGQELISVKFIGTMRGVEIARLEIAPIQYNPVKKTIRVYDHLEVEISFINGNELTSKSRKRALFSPFIEGIYSNIINYKPLHSDELILDAPATYIIVSDPAFESPLQAFVSWKTRKGFNVVEAYTDDPQVGTTTESIKGYLDNFYNNPPEGFLPQTYVLIVGDVDQLPSFIGTTGMHFTDLFYAEYTGDYLPDCFYGRFSANTIVELNAQITKTLAYENYQFETPAYLDSTLLILVDYGISSPQLWYAKIEYLNTNNGIVVHEYIPGNTDWVPVDKINNGVSFTHFCGPCSSSGFPSFSVSDIPLLTNSGKYSLIIGNCSESANFGITSFGEEIVRASEKGALSFIGATNSTYFYEDFCWVVGYKEVSVPILYNPDKLGFYDRWFHSHDEIISEWFVSQGQFLAAGNLAVSQSGSGIEDYYWEIYHLLGDPSVCIYLPEPSLPQVSYSSSLTFEDTLFSVSTEPYLYVALSMNSKLYGAAVSDENGIANISIIEPFTQSGLAEIIITGQNREPYFGTINVIQTLIQDQNQIFGEIDIFPNPFKKKLNIHIEIKETADLRISIIDLLGNQVQEIEIKSNPPGTKMIELEAQQLKQGIYFCNIKSKAYTKIIKIVKPN